ncbi:MAG: hypothetical protein OXT72_07960 [Gammaproteobacteria bacterium]|nr:hypothetical protein [Gammaproteobacteria bacterium]
MARPRNAPAARSRIVSSVVGELVGDTRLADLTWCSRAKGSIAPDRLVRTFSIAFSEFSPSSTRSRARPSPLLAVDQHVEAEAQPVADRLSRAGVPATLEVGSRNVSVAESPTTPKVHLAVGDQGDHGRRTPALDHVQVAVSSRGDPPSRGRV